MGDPLFTFRFAPLVIRHLGLDEAAGCALLEESGLPPDGITGAVTTSLSHVRDFLNRATEIAEDPDLGLHVGSAAPPGMLGLTEMVVRTAPRVADAMVVAARFYALINPVGRLTYEPATRRLDYHVVGGEHGHVMNELSFSYLYHSLQRVVAEPVTLEEAWFSHRRPAAPLEKHFGCPVRMGTPTTGFALTAAAAGASMLRADPAVHAFLVEQAERETAAEPVAVMLERVIEAQVGLPQASLDTVADAVGWPRRTLQRRLEEEGETFHSVVDNVRRRHALARLAAGEPKNAVARAIGLASAGSLRRAMARWASEP